MPTELDRPLEAGEVIVPVEDELTELYRLRREKGALERRIQEILGRQMVGVDERPMWGPCTRCGHIWRGHWPNRPPRGCARCGSTGWNVEPVYKNARKPGDPPNPKWGKNRITGAPTDPENVMGNKTRRERIEAEQAERERLELQRRRIPEERTTMDVKFPPGGVQPVALTPPPKLSELVAAPSVRFSEPQPERSVSGFIRQVVEEVPGGASSMAEREVSNLEVAGSNPASRSNNDVMEMEIPVQEADPTVDYARVEDENTHEVRWVPKPKAKVDDGS